MTGEYFGANGVLIGVDGAAVAGSRSTSYRTAIGLWVGHLRCDVEKQERQSHSGIAFGLILGVLGDQSRSDSKHGHVGDVATD